MASGCTLTADSFEPVPADHAEADDTPVVSGLPTEADGTPGNVQSTSPAGTGEGVVIPGRREPVEPNDGQLGTSSQATEVTDVGLPDTGGELDLPNVGAPDAGVASPPGESCPSRAFGASCYEFFAELASWAVAEQRCVDWGGHLASVGSPEEDGFLDDWPSVLEIPDADGSGIWLGGTDATRDGDFRWWDDSLLTFDNWTPNQPDNGAGVDCVEKRNDGTGGWFDQRCADQHPYVCERQL